MWARHGPLNLNQHRTWGEMNAGLIILRVASLGRDAQNDESVTELVLRSSVAAATPCLRRSSSSVAAAAPSQQRYNLALKWSSHRRSSISKRNAAAPRGGTQAARSISSVAAASAPSQQHQLRRERDAQNERDGAGLRSSVAAATPSQLRRSSAARTMSGQRGIGQPLENH